MKKSKKSKKTDSAKNSPLRYFFIIPLIFFILTFYIFNITRRTDKNFNFVIN